MVLKYIHTLIPSFEYVTLHSKGDFWDAIKFKDFENGLLAWIILAGPI